MELAALRLENVEEAERIHALAMADGLGGHPWTAETFSTLLTTPGTFGWLANDQGLLLIRHAGDEAEIFTIGVTPFAQRMGVARALLETAYIALTALKVERLLLEVAVDNQPAQLLYRAEGFTAVGRRPGYYKRGSDKVDAVIMERKLPAP